MPLRVHRDGDRIVSDQTVTILHEIQPALALPDPAVAREEQTDAVDIYQRTVDSRMRSQKLIDRRGQLAGKVGRSCIAAEHRHTVRFREFDELRRRRPPVRYDHARNIGADQSAERLATTGLVERVKERHLRAAEDLDPARVEPFFVSREEQPRLRQVRPTDCGGRPAARRHDHQPELLAVLLQQPVNRQRLHDLPAAAWAITRAVPRVRSRRRRGGRPR